MNLSVTLGHLETKSRVLPGEIGGELQKLEVCPQGVGTWPSRPIRAKHNRKNRDSEVRWDADSGLWMVIKKNHEKIGEGRIKTLEKKSVA